MAYNSTPTQVCQFLYGMDIPTNISDTWTNYADLFAGWDININPTPPSEPLYDEAKLRIDNRVDLYELVNSAVYFGVNGVSYYGNIGIFSNSNIQYWINRIAEGIKINHWLTHVDINDIPTSVIAMGYRSTSFITTGIMTYIDNTKINDLLEDYNIAYDFEIYIVGYKLLATTLSLTEGEVVSDLNDLFTNETGITPQESIASSSGINNYVYDFVADTVFNDVLVKVDLDVGKSFPAAWYTPSTNANIVLGSFIAPVDGMYEFTFNLIMDEDVDTECDRAVYLTVDVNGIIQELILAKYYLQEDKSDNALNAVIALPLDIGDDVALYVNGSSSDTDNPTNIQLKIREGFVNIKQY